MFNWNVREKIPIIKMVRAKTQSGLKESKEAVEETAELLGNSATDEQIIQRACFVLDTDRFPFPDEGPLDYEVMWQTLRECPLITTTMQEVMDETKADFEAGVRRIAIQTFVYKRMVNSLEDHFVDIQGHETVAVYDKLGKATYLDIPKSDLKELMQKTFNDWLVTL